MQFPLELLQECWFLAGPTACGKSELGVLLAEALGSTHNSPDVEIVSLDSMSLYRGMDIGTAKSSTDLRNRIPHHLLDVIDPHQEYSLAQYVEAAYAVCCGIVDRGSIPLFVGGTGLYLRGILRGVFDSPPADWEFRRQLERQAADGGPDFLHQQLQSVDPAAAEALHPNDTRRLVRALEVHHTTGKPISEQQQHAALPPEERPQQVYWLSPPRDWLYGRINRRVETMIEHGLVDEVRQLLDLPNPPGRTARQALGYKEIIEHLKGACSLGEAVELIQTRTRQFAKRQHTWFRNLEECTPIDFADGDAPETLASRLLRES